MPNLQQNGGLCRAVVLGGGGSKGAYQVGVWQAMEELSIPYHVVTGTSVGALNGALMVQGELDEALHMWRNLDNSRVMAKIPAPAAGVGGLRGVYRALLQQLLGKGGVDISPLEAMVRQLVDEERMRRSPVELGIVSVELPSMKPMEWFLPQIPKGQVADFLLASAACFPAFKPREIDNASYIDGGYTNNIPIDLALRAQQQVEEIIVIDVEGIGVVRPVNTELPIITLRCYWDLGNILIFDSARCRRNIRLGYLDGMKVLGDYGGQAYTFAPGQVKLLEERHLVRLSQLYLLVFEALSGEEKQEINGLIASRLLRAATHRRQLDGGDDALSEMLLASGELAAELLELSPTHLYTAEGFDEALLSGYHSLKQEAEESLALLANKSEFNLRTLISGWRKEQLLALTHALLHRLLETGNSSIQPELLAAALPKELIAALYLEALLSP